MRSFKGLIILLAVTGLSNLAIANTGEKGKKVSEGSVHGQIMDATTRKPVSGVTVSLSSSKIQGEKEIQSDASGYFNFGKLPAGEVTIMFEKKGYKLYRKEAMALKEGTTVKISVEVEPELEDDDIWHPLFRLMNDNE